MTSNNKNTSPMPARDKSLDFIKFVYIVMMITYHCFYNANYTHSLEIDINRYLIYVSGSFPFMAGYLISAHYFQKTGEQLTSVGNRLLSRGAKLIGIYMALNLIYYLLDKTFDLGITHPTEDAIKSLALGSPSEVIYDILYSIGLVLVYGAALSAIITKFHRGHSIPTLLITASILAAVIYIDRSLLIASGLAGIIIGITEIRCFFEKIYQHKIVIIASYLYGFIVALSIDHMRNEKLMYITGVITLFFSLKHSYSYIKEYVDRSNLITLLSRHSLFVYLFHIPFIIIAVKIFLNIFTGLNPVLLFAILILFVTYTSIQIIQIIDSKIKDGNKFGNMYKLIFN